MANEIFAAIREGDTSRVAALIAADPNVGHARNDAGVSALMQARYESRHAIVEMLREATDALDVFEAAALGDVARLRLLLEEDPARATIFSNDGATALQFACFFGQAASAEELLRRGADVNAVSRNAMRVTALHSAAASRSAELVKLILRAGADPNARQQSGYTALHSAAFHDDPEMARALIEAGADVAIRSDEGKTAMDLAKEKDAGKVLDVLKATSQRSAKGAGQDS